MFFSKFRAQRADEFKRFITDTDSVTEQFILEDNNLIAIKDS